MNVWLISHRNVYFGGPNYPSRPYTVFLDDDKAFQFVKDRIEEDKGTDRSVNRWYVDRMKVEPA